MYLKIAKCCGTWSIFMKVRAQKDQTDMTCLDLNKNLHRRSTKIFFLKKNLLKQKNFVCKSLFKQKSKLIHPFENYARRYTKKIYKTINFASLLQN